MAAVVHRIVLRTPETVGSMAQFTTLEQCRRESAEAASQAQNAQGFMGQASASAQAAALSATQASASAAAFPKGVAPGQLPPAWCLGSAAFQDMRFIDVSKVWTPPSLNPGAQATTWVAIPGGGTFSGDFVLCGCDGQLYDLILTAQVSGQRVNFVLTNLSSSTVNVGSATFHARVFKRIP
ncbi:hypothetical protein [Fundidesulfovibrio soli]|uniref:hypothetical protein n=1 Tax=Fundidesulfovibrio soli TaxID=2922716 RepID=UPI001FAF3D9F|nr:hypothetical protein [Fundidesulfovibrio soli]